MNHVAKRGGGLRVADQLAESTLTVADLGNDFLETAGKLTEVVIDDRIVDQFADCPLTGAQPPEYFLGPTHEVRQFVVELVSLQNLPQGSLSGFDAGNQIPDVFHRLRGIGHDTLDGISGLTLKHTAVLNGLITRLPGRDVHHLFAQDTQAPHTELRAGGNPALYVAAELERHLHRPERLGLRAPDARDRAHFDARQVHRRAGPQPPH